MFERVYWYYQNISSDVTCIGNSGEGRSNIGAKIKRMKLGDGEYSYGLNLGQTLDIPCHAYG